MKTTQPVRIQRKRTQGYNMQEHSRSINGLDCVYVGRGTKFGNPFKIGEPHPFRSDIKVTRKEAVKLFRLRQLPQLINLLPQLRGINLACFCAQGKPCHADVLLKAANRED